MFIDLACMVVFLEVPGWSRNGLEVRSAELGCMSTHESPSRLDLNVVLSWVHPCTLTWRFMNTQTGPNMQTAVLQGGLFGVPCKFGQVNPPLEAFSLCVVPSRVRDHRLWSS